MASDTWFRFYNTAPDHPKVLMLTDWQFRAWVTLLAVASKMGGFIPGAIDALSAILRKPPQKTADTIQVLLSAGLIDSVGEGYEPHNWTAKQFKSDVSTERVKRFRNGKRNANETVGGNGPETETKAETERKKKAARMARFNEFWNSCPKKTGKGPAEKAWLKALDLADADTLIAAMRAYAPTCFGKEKTYIKTPGPWLNERRWEDEGIAPAPPPDAAVVEAAEAAWDGRAAPLVAEIGAAQFQAWFSETKFEGGPPVKICFSKPFSKNWVAGHFRAQLQRAFGEYDLELAA